MVYPWIWNLWFYLTVGFEPMIYTEMHPLDRTGTMLQLHPEVILRPREAI